MNSAPHLEAQTTVETTTIVEHSIDWNVFHWFYHATSKELKARLTAILVIFVLCVIALNLNTEFGGLDGCGYNSGECSTSSETKLAFATWIMMCLHVRQMPRTLDFIHD